MADEPSDSERSDEVDPGAVPAGPSTAPADDQPADPVLEPDDDPGGDEARAARILTMAEALAERYEFTDANKAVLGELVVHYPARDVAFVLDGDAAIRLMMMWAQVGKGHLADELDRGSDAQNVWVAVDLDTPMAISWVPGRRGRNRVTVDPKPAG